MITTMTELFLLITVYITAEHLSSLTLLSRYNWFNDLALKLYFYNGFMKSTLQKIYYSKIFTCKSCNIFWISLIIYNIINMTGLIVTQALVLSLLIFLLHKVEGGN